jgi:hypothetical protein
VFKKRQILDTLTNANLAQDLALVNRNDFFHPPVKRTSGKKGERGRSSTYNTKSFMGLRLIPPRAQKVDGGGISPQRATRFIFPLLTPAI